MLGVQFNVLLIVSGKTVSSQNNVFHDPNVLYSFAIKSNTALI